MEITTLEVAGLYSALHGMRNPMDSWEKSDSAWDRQVYGGEHGSGAFIEDYRIGEKDAELSFKLAQAGTEHAKHLRMVMVWADITAPLYWWKQFDCYRIGVEKVSCSTMHTLMRRPLTEDDFEKDSISPVYLEKVLESINSEMELYKETGDQEVKHMVWRGIIQMLPQAFLQKRTVMMSYAALRNIYKQRKGHKLSEWHQFRGWVETLPESWMITDIL